MKINDLDLERFLPAFMREDKNFQGMIYALEKELKRINECNNLIKLYINIDNIDEHILDELAWQFNVPEYDVQYSVDIKRSIIKDCLSIHHRRGTVSAVKEVAEKIFGNAEIQEWFDYGGQPFHFKVSTTNISSDDEMIARFIKTVQETQNVRSHLDEVTIEVINSLDLFCGGRAFIIDEDCFETVNIY